MGVNKVILIGNLGKDPEIRYTSSQNAVCNFSLATSERRKDASGNWVDHTEWHNVIAFGKTAENCANYLKKGRQAYIEGKIQTRKWQDKEGKDRYTTEIIANVIQFIGNKGEGAGSSRESVPMAQVANGGAVPMPSGLQSADSIAAGSDVTFDDDDIPF